MTIEVGSIYELDGVLLECTKTNESGINVFCVVDEKGNRIITYHPKNPAQIIDYGTRLIYYRTNELKFIRKCQ